jgi:hypothetical protein
MKKASSLFFSFIIFLVCIHPFSFANQTDISTKEIISPTNSASIVNTQNALFLESLYQEIDHQSFLEDLDLIKLDIKKNKLPAAIAALNELIGKLKDNQQRIIGKCFPDNFEGYQATQEDSQLDNLFINQDNYGVLFSRHYSKHNAGTIDVNLVFSDPSIKEYINLINNPNLINNIENTRIVVIKDNYKALEKFSLEEKYYERNIIVNKELLINVVANGQYNKELLDNYIEAIKLENLDLYLH